MAKGIVNDHRYPWPLEMAAGDRALELERVLGNTITDGGCVVWLGARNRGGYGQVLKWDGSKGHIWRVHRYVYLLTVGAIPTGLQLDHTCRNRACVSWDHLEPVTNRENVVRGIRARGAARAVS